MFRVPLERGWRGAPNGAGCSLPGQFKIELKVNILTIYHSWCTYHSWSKAACYWGLKVTVLPKVVVISVKQFGKTRVIGAEFTQIGVKFSVTLKTLLKTGSFSVRFSDFTENGVTIGFQKSIGAQFGRFWSRLFWVFCMTVWVFSQ